MEKSIKEVCLKTINELLTKDYIQDYSDYANSLISIKSRLLDDEFRLAIVGEFSSGKSTFINALIGEDILKHGREETTASITRIVNVKQNDKRLNTCKVSFRNKDKPDVILNNCSELLEYTTVKSKNLKVAEEIDSVSIYVNILTENKNIVFIDTPGLNGMEQGHYEQTLNLIQKAHACIYMVQLRGIGQSDIGFLRDIAKFQKDFIFVQNFIDEIKSSEGDSVEAKVREIKEKADNLIFNDFDDVNYEICAVSSLYELCSKDRFIKYLYDSDKEELTDSKRKELSQKSGFTELYEKISKLFSEEMISGIKEEDCANVLINLLLDLGNQIELDIERAKESADYIKNESKKKDLENRIEKYKNSEKNSLNKLENFIKSQIHEIKKKCKKLYAEDIEKVKINWEKRIGNMSQDDCDNINKDGRFPYEFQKDINTTYTKSENYFRNLHKNLYNELVQRIVSYSGIKSFEYSENIIKVQLADNNNELEIKTAAKDKLYRKMNKLLKAESENEELENKLSETNEEIAKINRQLSYAEMNKNEKLSSLGPRPQEKVSYRQEKYTEDRKDWTYYIQWVIGPEEKTRNIPIRDDSLGQRYDDNKQKIILDYNNKIITLKHKLKVANERLARLDEEMQENNDALNRAQKNVEKAKIDLMEEEKLNEEMRQTAEAEYLKSCRKQLIEDLNKSIVFYVNLLNKNVDNSSQGLEQKYFDKAVTEFKKAFKKELKKMEEARDGNSDKTDKQEVEIKKIEIAYNEIKEYSNEIEGSLK